jgi:hypothetical protein
MTGGCHWQVEETEEGGRESERWGGGGLGGGEEEEKTRKEAGGCTVALLSCLEPQFSTLHKTSEPQLCKEGGRVW